MKIARYVLALILLSISPAVFAQGDHFQTNVSFVGNIQGTPVLRPVQTGYVSVCLVVGNVCNAASIYSDQALTVPMSNPIILDKTGNFGFWASAGYYKYAVCSSPSACGTYDVVLASVGPPGPPFDNQGIWSATFGYLSGQVVTFGTSVYMSKVSGNLNHQPDISPSQWALISLPGSVISAPGGSQSVIQPTGTTLASTSTNGMLNEELFSGSTVIDRVNTAVTTCTTVYTNTCLVVIPPYAPSGFGWAIPPNNVTIEDQRNLNGFGYPNGELTGMRANIHYVYHAGANDPNETGCTFCGKNVLVVDATADGGVTDNGSNASLQSFVASSHRLSTSHRQTWAGNFVNNFKTIDQTAIGIEIDTSNESGADDTGLFTKGLTIVNNGNHSGIGLQINSLNGVSPPLPTFRGFEINIDNEDYHVYGMKLASRDTARVADLYIVPTDDSNATASIIGRNSTDSSTKWSIQDDGAATFSKMTAPISVPTSVNNNTGMQHFRGIIGCTTAATAGSVCTSPNLPLPVAFPDTNYTLVCQVSNNTGLPAIVNEIKGTSVINIVIAAIGNVASTGSYNCTAMHD